MNGKKIACFLLVFLMAIIFFVTQMMTKRAAAMMEEEEAAKSEKFVAQTDSESAMETTNKLKNDTQELRQFLTTWTPVINRLQSAQDAEQALLGVVRNSGILTVSQKFEVKDSRENQFTPKIFQGTLIVQDEYSKTMNWLGELEVKIPIMRLTSCRIKQGETGRQMNLEVHFEVPLINLLAELDVKK